MSTPREQVQVLKLLPGKLSCSSRNPLGPFKRRATHGLPEERTCTCDPGQHGLQDFSAGAADDDANKVVLLGLSEVLRKERPKLLLLCAHMLLQRSASCRRQPLQPGRMLRRLRQRC